jgi:hypothetical protein
MQSFVTTLLHNYDVKLLHEEIRQVCNFIETVEKSTPQLWIDFATERATTPSMKQYALLLALDTMESYRELRLAKDKTKQREYENAQLKEAHDMIENYCMGKVDAGATTARELMIQIRMKLTIHLPLSMPKETIQLSDSPPPAGSMPVANIGKAVLKM